MKKRKKDIKKYEEKLKNEFSLSQKEIHDYGKLVLRRIQEQHDGLIVEPDHCWGLDEDLKLLTKLSIMVVRLQCGKTLREHG